MPTLPNMLVPADIQPNGKLYTDEEIRSLRSACQYGKSHRYAKAELIQTCPAIQARKLSHRKIFGIIYENDQLFAIYDGEKKGKLLGKGGYGKVKLAQNLNTGQWVVLKIFDTARLAEQEFKQLKGLKLSINENMIAHQKKSYIVSYQLMMPYVQGENLFLYYKKIHEPKLDLILKILHTVNHFHAMGWIHGDIKLANMIYAPDGSVHLIDFGLSRPIHDNFTGILKDKWSLYKYIAPERFKYSPLDASFKDGRLRKSADVYSLGFLIAEILGSDKRLYSGLTDVIEKMLNVDPTQRPTMDTVISVFTKFQSECHRDTDEIPVKIAKAMSTNMFECHTSSLFSSSSSAFISVKLQSISESNSVTHVSENGPVAPTSSKLSYMRHKTSQWMGWLRGQSDGQKNDSNLQSSVSSASRMK